MANQDSTEHRDSGLVGGMRASYRTHRAIIDNVVSIATALAVVFAIRWSVVESFKIPSGSMIPTLAIGDYLFVNKFAYGFKIPFTSWTLIPASGPNRGDVIVFKYPRDESVYFIKRIVGVPGDTIELRDKHLFINNAQLEADPLAQQEADKILQSNVLYDPQYTVTHPEFFHEHLGNGAHLELLDAQGFQSGNFGPVTVPADHYFAMGDNRDVSNDSRFWGFVPRKNIAGKAVLVWLSIFFGDHVVFHPERTGTLIR